MPKLPLLSLVACLAVACGSPDHPPPLGDPGNFDAGRIGSGGRRACNAGTFIGPADAQTQADLSALAGYTTITGDLYIGSNVSVPPTNVTSLAALDCLETVTGEVTILDSPLLTSLAGLESLASASALKIIATGLTSLQGLAQLAVSDVLLVQDCPALTTLTDEVASVGSLAIRDNVLLPQCTVDTFAARLGATGACTCSGNTGFCP